MPLKPGIWIGFLSLLMCGCQTAFVRTHAEYEAQVRTVRTIGILDPEVEVYEVSAGGVREKNDEWSLQGKRNVMTAIGRELSRRGFRAEVIAREGAFKDELDEINALAYAVIFSFKTHTTKGPNYFPDAAGRFDYSLGPVGHILDAAGVDGLLIVHAYGQLVTTLGSLGGNRDRLVVITMALAGREGTLLWYGDNEGMSGRSDLRDAERTRTIVGSILGAMPEVGR